MNKYFCNLLLIIFLLSGLSLQAQQTGESHGNVFQTIGSDIKTAAVDGFHLLISPANFSNKDLLIAGGTILTTAAVMPFDENFRKFAGRNHSDINDKISDAGKAYGNVITPVIIGGGIYSYGLIFKDEYVRTTGRMLIEAVAYSGAITTVIKTVAGRSRPYTNDGSHFYKPIQFNTAHTSFPSGHSTVAFAMSTVLAERINNTYASIGLYALAGITAASRVYSDDHWASDVFLGAAIGYFTGHFITHNSGTLYKSGSGKLNVSFHPSLSGFVLSADF